MADVATAKPNGAGDASATKSKPSVTRVEKPDDDQYKKDLEKAEKEHAASQEKLVGYVQL
ncbi:hypothetical protein P152DRAFT_454585 [Eremomyces bilateralis CBS 781.70]|uniref:Uncharacterized protein n=1 Tax=Eremomyces bilateralis CBS 781.70 TaxID=1392243 RepID=A0A6G1GEM0_9PEZI|nr:uncharacterized protein P152DRAFT_454585 [Eremomyces bilateralis CBS 781.70]KAF1816319.1 hypothetical protein P152DRAFT_454585 [Eremomyces bilateralis CBS 781.70]